MQPTLPIAATRWTAFKGIHGTISMQASSIFFREGILAQLSYPVEPSAGVAALPQSLSRNTLLTGTAHTFAGVYTIGSSTLQDYFPGNLGVCAGPAPRGLHTSKGDLFLQDLEGGSLLLNNPPSGEAGSEGGWDLANSGFLHVEVIGNDD